MHFQFRSLAHDLESVPTSHEDLGFPEEDPETMLLLDSLAEEDDDSPFGPDVPVSKR